MRYWSHRVGLGNQTATVGNGCEEGENTAVRKNGTEIGGDSQQKKSRQRKSLRHIIRANLGKFVIAGKKTQGGGTKQSREALAKQEAKHEKQYARLAKQEARHEEQ